ncbi:unnamed protein product [Symbiodinium natans]|uniref:TraB domain-containing protein n=1 Tax=Symbiodinium natans TaxID=878477 RepID=A0A812PJ44_9DINO|nr:unnamed protein product [Symbiodinium natans]
MHFNPFSVFCTKSLVMELLDNKDNNTLAAVVLEMFDDRWQRMQTLHPPGSFQRALLDNEMQAAAETAGQDVPVLFGDLSDEELDAVLQEVAAATLQDVRSASGWARIGFDVVNCFSTLLSSPKPYSSELGVSDASTVLRIAASILLLVSTPIAILRNFLVLAMEAPFSSTAGLLLLGLLIPALLLPASFTESAAVADPRAYSSYRLFDAGWLVFLILPVMALWRVQLRGILTERDSHMARCIADACARHGGPQKVVFAVVGTLHMAGISKKLECTEADMS